jgi:dipeptidyl-peptidase 4
MSRHLIAAIALTLAAALPAQAQNTVQAPALLPLERVYASPALNGPTLRSPALSPDGVWATWLQANANDALRLDIWGAPIAGGEPRMLVDSRALVPVEAALSPEEIARRERQRIAGSRGIVDYSWDARGEAILVPLGGDIYRVALATPDQPQQLTDTPDDFETDAKLSPTGTKLSFIRASALWVMDLANGESQRVSPASSQTVSYGVAEFIAQEEMDRDTGYWWAPGDGFIAFTEVDESPVAVVPRVEIGATATEIIDQRYPRAGAANAIVRLLVRNNATARTVYADLGSDTDIYVARVDWSKDGRTLYVQRQNRAQTRLDLLAIDPETGASRVILTETDPAWINLTHDFTPLGDGGFLWTSERTGWRHISVHNGDGTLRRTLTAGDWAVRAIEGVDEAAGRVYFSSNKADPLAMQLWSVELAAQPARPGRRPLIPPRPSLVTGGEGSWAIKMNASGTAFIGTFSSPSTPPQSALFRADGSRVRWLQENRLDHSHPWGTWQRAEIRYGTLTGPSGETLHWSMHLPPGFDPSKRYPVIQYVYGGPGVQVVTRSWGSNVDQFHAARGFIVFRMDNRGTPNRGRNFERALHMKLGTIEVEDQLAGLAFLRAQAFVDPDRIGVWGWSYGGYMALRMAVGAPTAWNAYVAGAPVTDWGLYDTHYTERFMGTPQANREAYEASSVLPGLGQVQRPLLILHGMADDNVTFDNATMAFDRLQAASIPFEAMVYPGQRHGIREPGRATHLQRTITNFFDRTLRAPQTSAH